MGIKVSRVNQEKMVHLVQMVKQVRQVHQAQLEKKERGENKAYPEELVVMVYKVLGAFWGFQDQ